MSNLYSEVCIVNLCSNYLVIFKQDGENNTYAILKNYFTTMKAKI